MPAIVIQGVAATSAFLAKTSHDILVSTEKAITEAGLFIKAEKNTIDLSSSNSLNIILQEATT